MIPLSFKTIFLILATFALFFGILSSLSFHLLKVIAEPFSAEAWKDFGIELAKVLVNSQREISRAVEEFKDVENEEYANFLIARIIGASLISLSLVYFTYRVFRFFVEAPSMSAKILMIILSFFVVYLIQLICTITIGEPEWIPYKGFIDLIAKREYIVNYLLSKMQ